MTADLDLSPEAVERLAERLVHTPRDLEEAILALLNPPKGWPAYAAVRALAAENARLRAERDAAWQAGAEAMRSAARAILERRVKACDEEEARDGDGIGRHCGLEARLIEDRIRALPLTSQPKEGEA